MKKILVIGIAVLFALVGFRYASAQVFGPYYGGPLTTLSLDVTYQEEVGATNKLSQGEKRITVASRVREYDPVLFFTFDTYGNLTNIAFDWSSPNSSSPLYGLRIYTISCSGGNQLTPEPGLPAILDGIVLTTPQTSISNPPARETSSFEGVATCYICPGGFTFNSEVGGYSPGVINGYCNDGSSYGQGYLTFKGTFVSAPGAGILGTLGSEGPTSISVTGQIGGGGFNYVGYDWGTENCYSPPCKALFTGTFGAKLIPCIALACYSF